MLGYSEKTSQHSAYSQASLPECSVFAYLYKDSFLGDFFWGVFWKRLDYDPFRMWAVYFAALSTVFVRVFLVAELFCLYYLSMTHRCSAS